MTITAKYPGRCAKCGGKINPGDQIEWDKATRKTSHVTCPTQAVTGADEPAPWTVEFESAVKPGYVFARRDGKYLTVVRVRREYIPRDIEDCRYDHLAGGYIYIAACREATAEEASPLIAARKAAEEQRAAKARAAEIARQIQNTGETPDGVNVPEGDVVLDTATIYGTGDWFVVGPAHIWYVRNNGMDGDDWSRNNVRTGGAGAIGWRIPFDAALAEELRKLDAMLVKKS